MDYQDKFRGYLSEVEEVGTKDKKEVVAEFLKYFKLCKEEQSKASLYAQGEELFKLIGETRATFDTITMIEGSKEELNPKPKGEQT